MLFADVVDVDKPEFFSAGLRNDNGIRADAEKKKLDGQNFFEAPVKPRRG